MSLCMSVSHQAVTIPYSKHLLTYIKHTMYVNYDDLRASMGPPGSEPSSIRQSFRQPSRVRNTFLSRILKHPYILTHDPDLLE